MQSNYNLEELLPIMTKLTEQYTSKDSTSIPYETAQQLMGAILYCLDQEALPWDSSGHSQVSKVNESLEERFLSGRNLILSKIDFCKRLFASFQNSFLSFGNRAYEDTVLVGMPEFFKWYDHRYNPQADLLSLDYPVLISLEEYHGIDRIAVYLKAVDTEQRFLRGLPVDFCNQVLTSYHSDFEELLVNLPFLMLEYVLISSLQENGVVKGNREMIAKAGDVFLTNHFPEDSSMILYFQNAYETITMDWNTGLTRWISPSR